MMDASERYSSSSSEGRGFRFKVRFGLIDLLLVSALVAAWVPLWWAKPKIPDLENDNQSWMKIGEVLPVSDETLFSAMSVRPVRYQAQAWKIFVPKNAKSELRFAAEGVAGGVIPDEFDRIQLRPGVHRISFVYRAMTATKGREVHDFEIYVDHNKVLAKQLPWLPNNGVAVSSAVGEEPVEFPKGSPIELFRGQFQKASGSKGYLVWIAPE